MGTIHVHDPNNNGLRDWNPRKNVPPKREGSTAPVVHAAPDVTPQLIPATNKEGRRSRHWELRLQTRLREQDEIGTKKPPFIFLVNIAIPDKDTRRAAMANLAARIMEWEYGALIKEERMLTAPYLYEMQRDHGDPFDGISISGISMHTFDESRLLMRDLYQRIELTVGPASLNLRLGGYRGLLTYNRDEAAAAAAQGAELVQGD